MYKRFNLDEISSIKNNFLQNLSKQIVRERCGDMKTFFKKIFLSGDEVYFFFRGQPLWRFIQDDENYKFIDEREKIELILPKTQLSKVNNLLKTYILKKGKAKEQKSIAMIL